MRLSRSPCHSTTAAFRLCFSKWTSFSTGSSLLYILLCPRIKLNAKSAELISHFSVGFHLSEPISHSWTFFCRALQIPLRNHCCLFGSDKGTDSSMSAPSECGGIQNWLLCSRIFFRGDIRSCGLGTGQRSSTTAPRGKWAMLVAAIGRAYVFTNVQPLNSKR